MIALGVLTEPFERVLERVGELSDRRCGTHARLSDDAIGPQLLHARRAISQPLAVDERIVLADERRRPGESGRGVGVDVVDGHAVGPEYFGGR